MRRASPEDGPALLSLIDALASYEKLDCPEPAARERLIRDMFCDRPRVEAFLCELDGKPVGYTLVFETYSSFLALPTLYLEDFFVLAEYRGRKAGWALFREMVAEAKRRGCGRMEWTVLTWNRLAIDFYERFGASRLDEWAIYRMRASQMDKLLGAQKPSQT